MVGGGGRELRTDAPVGNHSEQVIGRHFTVASHVAEAGDWAWRVIAGRAFTEPCETEVFTVFLGCDHARKIVACAAGTLVPRADLGNGVAAVVGVVPENLRFCGDIAADAGVLNST